MTSMNLRRVLALFCTFALTGCDDPAQTHNTSLTAEPSAPRIITLAPHLTELVFEAGAGHALVGVVEYSDYPDAARSLPRIGDAFRVDVERVMGLNPDIVLAWSSGNPQQMVDQLAARGLKVTTLEPVHMAQIAEQIEFIGGLAGTAAQARKSADAFRDRMALLQQKYRGRESLSVFYQISPQPLYTINSRQIISEAISLCGGNNIFSDLGELAPVVSAEAVVTQNPEAILAPQIANEDPFERWRSFSVMTAVRRNNLFPVNADLVARATPRLLDGVVQICEALDTARSRQ